MSDLRGRVAEAIYEVLWGDITVLGSEAAADAVLAALMPLREVDLAQRLVLTLGEKRYPVRSLERAGDRITLTAQLEDS